MSTSVSDRRKEELELELERLLVRLIPQYQPDEVILFGSLAQGEVRVWSDLDLIIIKDTPKRFLDRTAEVLEFIDPRVGADILVYTPEEFEQLCRERPFFKEEIMAKGRVIYERDG